MTACEEFDYVVVGAGSAGCVLAARLSQDGASSVALVEAGGMDRSFWIHTPLGYGFLFDDPAINWMYESAPEPFLHDTRIFQPRGRVVGGTGSINGMVYVRGHKDDFDEWAALGNSGWSYEEILPYFIRSERNSRGENRWHGIQGPLHVSDIPRHELADAFIEAGCEAGYPLSEDFNGSSQEGFGYNQLTIGRGRRSSTASAFLHPALRRPNLHLILNGYVDGILLENRAATGVRIMRDGMPITIRARREIVLCAGVYGSPTILQRSGIGNPQEISRLGLEPVLALPGVGANLQDHFTVAMLHRCLRPVTINDTGNSFLRRLGMGLRYLLTRDGLMATNASFCGGYVRSSPEVTRPDLKFNLALWGRTGVGRTKERLGLLPYSSFTPSVVLLRPSNRGTVRALSPDPTAPPEIRFNFLEAEADQRLAVTGLRMLRQVLSMPSMTPFLGDELSPGPSVQSDDDLLDVVRRRGRSNHHAVGTCRMGQDAMAVVDHELRLHGVERLRVADASIMPTIVSGNTNAAVVMIAEKAAAMMKGERP